MTNDFLDKLSNIRVVNTTIRQTLKQETEKLIYTTCVLPDEGVDLLNGHINEVNMILVGKGGKQ